VPRLGNKIYIQNFGWKTLTQNTWHACVFEKTPLKAAFGNTNHGNVTGWPGTWCGQTGSVCDHCDGTSAGPSQQGTHFFTTKYARACAASSRPSCRHPHAPNPWNTSSITAGSTHPRHVSFQCYRWKTSVKIPTQSPSTLRPTAFSHCSVHFNDVKKRNMHRSHNAFFRVTT
jgi:hypothetical protein